MSFVKFIASCFGFFPAIIKCTDLKIFQSPLFVVGINKYNLHVNLVPKTW